MTTLIVGISGGSTLLALDLVARGRAVTVIADDGEDVSAFAGAFSWPNTLAHARVEVERRLASADLGLCSSGGPFTVVTALGQVVTADVIAPTILPLSAQRPVVVVGFRGWREWDAATIVSGLTAAGKTAEVCLCQLQGSSVDASVQALRLRLSDASFRRELVASLSSLLGSSVDLLFPPILSSEGDSLRASLAEDLAMDKNHLGEAVASWPSLCGQSYFERIRRALTVRVKMFGAVNQPPLLTVTDGRLMVAGHTSEHVVIGSRRAALWLEQQLGLGRGDDYRVDAEVVNLWRCGRAKRNVTSMAEDFASSVELASDLASELMREVRHVG